MNRYIIKTYTRAGFVASIPAHNGAHIRRWAVPVVVKYLQPRQNA
jgi:hypothetical protein